METMTREAAWALLNEYNHEPFHLRHAVTVEGVMRYFAGELGYADEVDFWGIVGLLHDLDFEQFPDQHCIKEQFVYNILHCVDTVYSRQSQKDLNGLSLF